jgi:CBS domain-containing protein
MADQARDRVEQYMTPEVLVVHADDQVPDAVAQLVERGVDAAPVLDASGNLVGMLSASDIMVQDARVHLPTIVTMFSMSVELPGEAARYNRDIERALASTVGELMAHDPVVIAADASVTDAATLMHDEEVSRLPVVDADGRLVGIIARGDVLRYLVGADVDRSTGD